MKNLNIFKAGAVLFLLTGTLLFSGCSSDDDPAPTPVIPQFSGSRASIENYVTADLLETMEGLGLEIHEGKTPPKVSGQFMDSPNTLQASNIEGSTPGSLFADTLFKIQNQNLFANTIDISYTTPGNVETSSGIGAVVAGHDDLFTIVAKQKIVHDDKTADGIMMISGRLTNAGIEDFQFAVFMLDNHGHSTFIANKKGRLFHDGDNVASKQ